MASPARQICIVVAAVPGWTGDRLRRLYEHVATATAGAALELVWAHAGASPERYRDALALQSERLARETATLRNRLRCRLHELEPGLEALIGPHFDQADIGLDELTVDGRPALPRLAAMRALRRPVEVALILSRRNLSRLAATVEALAAAKLPWHATLARRGTRVPAVPASEALDDDEARAVLGYLLEHGLDGEGALVEPIRSDVERVRRLFDPHVPCRFHDRRGWERRYVVDATGAVHGPAGPYGNVLEQPLSVLDASTGHLRDIEAAERRMARVCGPCRFYGACAGDEVAETASGACPVRRPTLERVALHLGRYGVRMPGPPDDAFGPALRPGSRVHLGDAGSPLGARVRLSAGTEVARPSRRARFRVGARIPRPPWRAPSGQELSLLSCEDGWRRNADVAVFNLPESVIGPLRSICEACGLYSGTPSGAPSDHPGWARAASGLEAHLGPFCRRVDAIDASVIYASDPGLPAVTKVDRGQPHREAYIGLHLDSWEGTSLRRRSHARVRIGINLSRQPRYLLFVNLPLEAMMRATGLPDEDDLDEISLFAGHTFLRRYPDYPVVRIEIAAGEAYLAPTGNLVHDGASGPGPERDVALHVLGDFALP